MHEMKACARPCTLTQTFDGTRTLSSLMIKSEMELDNLSLEPGVRQARARAHARASPEV